MKDWKEKAKAELKSILEREEGMMKAWTGAYDLACFIADKLDSEIEERKHYHQKAIWWEEQFSALRAELARATRALERAGFTDNGAEEWKPPLGWGDTGTQRERLIALEDKLARVKAESLRVVVVPDEGNLYDWYMTPTGLGYPGKDRKNNNCIESAEGYYRLDECKPVRLERWEDE